MKSFRNCHVFYLMSLFQILMSVQMKTTIAIPMLHATIMTVHSIVLVTLGTEEMELIVMVGSKNIMIAYFIYNL